MNRGVVLHSGGLDSTVLLTKLLQEGKFCRPLNINYGQRHIKESEAAKRVVKSLDLEGLDAYLDLSNMAKLICTALHGKGDIPHGHYSDEIQKATVSPNRNMILLAIAAGYAETLGDEFVAYAAHSNDRAIYADCRPEFITSVRETIKLGTDGKIDLIEPFAELTKAEVVGLGLEIGAPLEMTWSCYEGEKRPCLQCGTCLERTEAFVLNATPDPALSTGEWERAIELLDLNT